MTGRIQTALAVMAGLAGPAAAHPHIFVDTALTLRINDRAEVESVEVRWLYDELFSLLMMQDMGVDDDADGELTADEMAVIDGWDMKWIEGYPGDLYLTAPDGEEIALGEREPVSSDVTEARLVSVHRRPLGPAVPAEGLVLQAYDPEFYTAYDLTGGVHLTGAGAARCRAEIGNPDQDAAYREAQEVMSAFPEDAEEVPLLGHLFAQKVTIRCGSGG